MKFIKKFWRDNRLILTIFVLWRGSLFALGFLSFQLLTFKASFPYINNQLIASGFPQWFWHWGNFDGVHYLGIAQSGYLLSGTQVFFPLYPLLIKLFDFLTTNPFLSGFLVSNITALAAALLLFHLVRKKFDRTIAAWTVAFLFAFPTSFFFGSIYTESLFLALVLAAFSFKGLKSGIFSYFAGLTRLVGGFIGFGAAGVATYSLYLWAAFGKPLYFLQAQGSFANNRANSLTSLVTPPQVLVRYLKIFLTAGPGHYDYWIAVLEFAAFIFGIIVLGWLTWKRKVPVSWLVFSWAALILPSFSGTLSSMPRYLLTIFPIFIGLALIKSQSLKIILLFLSFLFLALLTTLFVRGYWVA